MSCSMNSTVVRSSASAPMMMSIRPNFSSTLMPLVGSSSRSAFGFLTVAMAMSSSLRTPCGRALATVSR